MKNESKTACKDKTTAKVSGRKLVEHEFPALFNEESEVLLLGSIPSPKSREQGFYYGHPQNRFWKVMANILEEREPSSIEEKKAMLLKHRIALWDVLDSCTIVGASDSSIDEVKPNDFTEILSHTKISRIFCTGATAHKLYEKYCEKATGIAAIKLPSTSPANCATGMDKLVAAYSQILHGLDKEKRA